MVASFNPSWRGIVAGLRLAVIAAGGTPSVTNYPANWGGAIRAIDDLRGVIASASPIGAINAHVAQTDPHSQYATDSDLAAHTSNFNNPHSTTAAQVGAAAGNDARLAVLGELRLFAMAVTAPWLPCDGAAVSRTTYAALFAAIGTTWGVGNGTTTFNVPDLRGRTLLGSGTGTSLTARTLAATGGTETHTLITAEMPAHTHQVFTAANALGGIAGAQVAASGTSQATSSTGGGGAHNNMPPFAVVNYAIYAGV